MSEIVPILSKNRDVRAVAQMLRDLADGLERGAVGHVAVVAEGADRPVCILSVAEDGGLHGVIGALEIVKAQAIEHVLSMAAQADDVAEGA